MQITHDNDCEHRLGHDCTCGASSYQFDLAAARTEIERLKHLCDDHASSLIKADAEIERLKEECAAAWDKCEERRLAQEKAEAERDKARAWVAMAFRMAVNEVAKGPGFIDRIRELTAPDAKAALEAYGREKVREGMKWAAEIIRGCCPECQGTGLRDSGGVQPWGEPVFVTCDCADAILAGMEKLA